MTRDMKDRYEEAIAARESRIATLTSDLLESVSCTAEVAAQRDEATAEVKRLRSAIGVALLASNTMTGSAHDRSLRVVADRVEKMEAILRAALNGEETT